MAQIVLDESNVNINLSMGDAFLSVHGSLHIPFEHIVSARVEDESGWSHMWFKLAGTDAPGLKMAGTFWLRGGLAFLNYNSGRNCIVIETRSETYKTLIVEPDEGEDAAALAERINEKVAA